MARSDDLVPLLAPGRSTAPGYRQGVVVSWDQNTAENIISVGGALLENLPILNTSEASLLQVNDVVVLTTLNGSWAILGRVIIPGTPEAASSIQSITNRIHVASNVNFGTRTPGTGYGDLAGGTSVGPEITVNVGTSGRVLAIWSCQLGATLNWQSNVSANASIEVSGATTIAASSNYAVGMGQQHPISPATGAALSADLIQAASIHVFTGLNPGSTTFTMKYESGGATPSNPVRFSQRELALFVL